MRIWSLHPRYLDTKGLIALWRETLLAKHVLEGRTKGYRNHPQLNRFKCCNAPLDAINYYLRHVHEEAVKRHYNFDESKFQKVSGINKIPVHKGQIEFELTHLLNKLSQRDVKMFAAFKTIKSIEPHPLFTVVEGDIEEWEVGSGNKT